ncbi:putative ATP-dependent DNA/RNA helicase [Bombilactobacillus mellifer]|uniref:Putative ATP-dependent DNA/RNA helicase n=1 Tax=Bombilactobacillus mellifer TaxID=1218492 RepID=A0A0F4LW87_9LACO|nr:DEAD/DEAH box helicase [Bombilactobacillus mellifer]KJY62628.1 putative ATP-dependent DNA/RNA helicase [Bombilactobacillus mellifer]MCT6825901.1 DEAD/DEAH box helicase [Bombilactobacillus mellifer]MCT6843710.1 DEAD/DEAH box helicase [Bombilactobacillus mellifer]MCT6894158.1 DEAD/DEAH box helicase [Bombilactobacillus mellifer]
MSTFADYNFAPFLQQALAQIKFTKPTPVQQQVIPVINAGRDAVVQAQTGSGKTHAYLLPLLNQLTTAPVVQIVITAPSRELAYQIRLAAEQLLQPAAHTWKIGFYVGGTDKQHQIASLRKQQPQIVIGTPGRILDLLKSQHLLVNTTQHLVIDEADMTLDMGFLNDVDRIASAMPAQLQMLVFSATIPQKLQPFLKKYLHQPQNIQLTVPTIIAPNITNWALFTRGRDRKQVLYQVLTMGQPYLALIFANTKTAVTEIYEYLAARGLNVTQIHGDLPARTRRRTMKAIENMEYQYVVASDLAARGIDIPGVSHVINAEIPREDEFFIHRVGRTGRNQMSGLAITLFDPDEIDKISHLEELGIKFVIKQIKNHEFVDYQLNQRRQRRAQSSALDPGLRGLVKKQQRKKKPGYRKKIKQAIKTDRAQKRKLAQRLQKKQQRQARKQQS